MAQIFIEKADEKKLEELNVDSWPIWEKETSKFEWSYDEKETCYILEGNATVCPEDGEFASFGAGDIVVFPAGMKCTWEITVPIRKRYKMG
ncbi:MAG: cupin domain-containing protein [Candidatus Omnitrophica bacterium]|nr:cupin domain-containing protein [Candidatus Omnitrophota bacterium]